MMDRSSFGQAVLVSLVLVVLASGGSASNDDLRLPEPQYPSAVTLYREGRAADALAELDRALRGGDPTGEPIDATLLRAVLLEAAGRPADAATSWKRIADRDETLRAYAVRALISNLASRNVADEALAELEALVGPAGFRSHLDLANAVADAFRRRGDPVRAGVLYRRVLELQRRGTEADGARLGLAATLEAGGDVSAAIESLREAQLQHRLSSTFVSARAAERRLASGQDRQPGPWHEEQYRALIERLRDGSRYDVARQLIDEWRGAYPQTTLRDVLDRELVETLYTMRANNEAVAAADRFGKTFPSSSLLPDVLLTRFRLDVRLGRTAAARDRGRALLQGRVRGATTGQRRAAGDLLAAYLISVGEINAGLEIYRELFGMATSADDQRTFLWKAGVAALRAGHLDRAVTNLRALVDRRPSGDLEPAALYWLGIALLGDGQPAEGDRIFRDLERRFRYHYYGIRAAERRGALAGSSGQEAVPDRSRGSSDPRDVSLEFPSLDLTQTTRSQPEFRAAMTFARAGLLSQATTELTKLLAERRSDGALALATARAAAEAGNYHTVSTVMTSHFGPFLERPARSLPDDFWSLLYPRPFWREIQAAAKDQDVDPVFMLALMRQESRFDPAARSAVGAIGLFQIMPYTAANLGAGLDGLNRSKVDEGALMRPSINAAIAARLTSHLVEMFGGRLAPVAASYNAGADRVAVWWKAAGGLDEDLFVDSIPYTETRRFVREVLANYWNYKRIYR